MWSHVHPDVQPSQNSILNGLFNAFLMLGLNKLVIFNLVQL